MTNQQASGMDRRSFLTGAAALGAAGVVASIPSVAQADEAETEAEETAFELTRSWDAEYDVIVVGFGGAGAATAITAADEGASVLLLEKAPLGYSGGNSNICMQWVCTTEDKEGVYEYFDTLRGGWNTPSDEILDVYIDGMMENQAWLESLGATNVTPFTYQEYSEFPGVDSFVPVTVDGSNGMTYPTVFGGNGACYKLLRTNVLSRSESIDVWYEAPAKELIQDPETKIIHGVVAEVDGEEIAIRAKNGVVLTCGGFEENAQMQQDFTSRGYWPSTGGCYYNEGDGITMAQRVGASMWHLSNVVTNNGEFYDEESRTATFGFGAWATGKGVYIGPDGSRVFDGSAHHGKVDVNGEYQNASIPATFWDVWDQGVQDLGPINQTWSDDSSEEIEKGWIITADTLEELVSMMGYEDEDAEAVLATIEEYNGFCADGYDPLYGRSSDNLYAIETAPFYACLLHSCLGNTQGGPRRNENGQILDVDLNPIPHLYESGELGDIWSNLYQAACNLGGGLIFGRISGKNAAAAKNDNYQGSVLEGEGFQPTVVETEYEAGENQYIGKGQGKSPAEIVVRVTMDGDAISDVEILEHYETYALAAVNRALTQLPAAIVEANTYAVDNITGATRTTVGITEAVADALSQVE